MTSRQTERKAEKVEAEEEKEGDVFHVHVHLRVPGSIYS